MEQIKIFLTTPEAIIFREFQRHHETFELLRSQGVFDIKNGKITLHFDSLGTLQKIERNDVLFDARVKVINN